MLALRSIHNYSLLDTSGFITAQSVTYSGIEVMAPMNLASIDPRKVEIARRRLQLDLDNSKLLRTFFKRDFVSMMVAIEMIADGTINSTHLFREPPTIAVTDSTTSTEVPYPVSFLHDLIDFYT